MVTQRTSTVRALLLVSVVFVGCGESVTQGDVGVSPPMTDLKPLQSKLVSRYCELVETCPRGSEVGTLAVYVTSPDACPQVMAPLAELTLAPVRQALDRGTVTYVDAAASTCLEAAQAEQACDASRLKSLADCAFVGVIEAGEACQSSVECLPGLFCDNNTACPGVCVAQGGVGDSCSSSAACESASAPGFAACLFDEATGSESCAVVTVAATLAGAEQPCGLLGSGGAYSQVSCQAGHYCAEDSGLSGTCRVTIPGGQPCEEEACDAGYRCSATPEGAVCAAVELVQTAGESCAPDGFALCDPFGALFCDPETLTCQMWGDGSVGAMCPTEGVSLALPGLLCASGNFCDRVTGRCAPGKAVGQSCEQDEECASAHCDRSQQACSDLPGCTD